MSTGSRFVWQCLRNVCLTMAAFATGAEGATLPSGFTESLVASGLNDPTAMQFAPDGRSSSASRADGCGSSRTVRC